MILLHLLDTASPIAICKAAVPFTVATANLDPVNSATFVSNSATLAPTEETKLESIQSTKYWRSFPQKLGGEGIKSSP